MDGSMAHDGAWMMKTSLLPVFPHYWDTNAQTGKRGIVYWELDAAFALVLAGLFIGFVNLVVVVIFACCKKLHLRPTVFNASLAFTHVFQLMSSPFAAMVLRRVTCDTNVCGALVIAWFVCSYSGVVLHLLVVLEFMQIRMKPHLSSRFQHLSWNLPVVLASYLIGLVSYYSQEAFVFMGSVALALTCLIVIFTFISCCSMDKRVMLAVLSAVLTVGLTYIPSFVAVCKDLNHMYDTRYVIFQFLTNMRLVTDGFLCWVICWGPPKAAQEQSEDIQVNLETPLYDSLKTTMRSTGF